jgi:hypothetical protein
VPTESPLSQENQRLLIEAYLKLLETLNVETPLRERSSEHCHLVYVHGIRTHVTGYSDGWWGALKPYTTLFGACQLDDTRHEVLWSNLVNSRSAQATRSADEAAIAALQERIMDVLEDRHRRQAAPAGRSAAARAEVEQEVQRARQALREQVAALAVAGAERILKREVDASAHAAMLNDLKQAL